MAFLTEFTAIIGLLGVWRGERVASATRDRESYDDFLEWLRRREHRALCEAIEANGGLAESLQAMIADQHNDLVDRLRRLDEILCGVARHIGSFENFAVAVHQPSVISEDAVSILRQMNAGGAEYIIETHSDIGVDLIAYPRCNIDVQDERFLQDDLATLCEYGLLRRDSTGQGDWIFYITRQGAAVGDAPS